MVPQNVVSGSVVFASSNKEDLKIYPLTNGTNFAKVKLVPVSKANTSNWVQHLKNKRLLNTEVEECKDLPLPC